MDKIINKKNQSGSNFQTVILHKKNRVFLGCAGLHKIDTKTPKLGIWIKKTAQGNGYGKEAMTALKTWTDENLNYEYLLYPVDTRNNASRKIPKSLGGEVAREYDEISLGGKKLQVLEYRIYHEKK